MVAVPETVWHACTLFFIQKAKLVMYSPEWCNFPNVFFLCTICLADSVKKAQCFLRDPCSGYKSVLLSSLWHGTACQPEQTWPLSPFQITWPVSRSNSFQNNWPIRAVDKKSMNEVVKPKKALCSINLPLHWIIWGSQVGSFDNVNVWISSVTSYILAAFSRQQNLGNDSWQLQKSNLHYLCPPSFNEPYKLSIRSSSFLRAFPCCKDFIAFT